MWIVKFIPRKSMDNLIKVWTILSTLFVRYVNSVLCKDWTLSQKVWTIWTKCGQNCPHLESNGKQYTWTVYVNSFPIGLKVWTIVLKCGRNCPHFLQTWCTVSYYPETCLYLETNPETCFNLANFCKLGSQYTSNITFIKLLYSWNSPWPEYIKNLEKPTSNNSNTYALPLSLHWDHKIH